MTVDEALAFLAAHQPMPSDHDVSTDECTVCCDVLRLFTANPDGRCIPLLINSITADTGLGMYEAISAVLMSHPSEQVIPHLRTGLLSGNTAIIYRCCWWACDVRASGLSDVVRPLLHHEDDDIRDAAESFFEICGA